MHRTALLRPFRPPASVRPMPALVPRLLPALCAALLAIALAGAAIAQAPDGSSGNAATAGLDVFDDRIDVGVINVEVVVEDGEGNRVVGLGAEDFQLTVGGRALPIAYFTEVRDGTALDDAAADDAPWQLPAAEPGAAVGLWLLVWIDEAFTLVPERDRAVALVRDGLDRLSPDDRVALVGWDGRRPQLLRTWTPPGPELARAFDAALERRARGLRYRAVFGGASSRANEAGIALSRLVDGAVATLHGFAQPPGRRAMLMLAGDWPGGPFDDARTPIGGIFETDRDRLQPLVDTANRLGYTLYVSDLVGRGTLTASSVSSATGGRAVPRAALVDVLPTLVDDVRSFYWLGLSTDALDDVADASRQAIAVAMANPELRIRHRADVRSRADARDRTRMRVVSRLLFGGPREISAADAPGAGAALRLDLQAGQRASRSRMMLPMTAHVGGALLTGLPATEGVEAVGWLWLAALAEDGTLTTAEPGRVRVVAANGAELAAAALSSARTLDLPRQAHRLIVALHDPASDRLVSRIVEVTEVP